MLRIVIAGSRGFDDYELLERTLDQILDEQTAPVELVSGHAKGADLLAEKYAGENGLPIHIIKPDWKTYGRAAGTIRNLRQAVQTGVEVKEMSAQLKRTRAEIRTRLEKLGLTQEGMNAALNAAYRE